MSNDRTPSSPDDFGDLEERLRVALTQEARDMEPHDRLDDIRSDVNAGASSGGRPRWLAPVGAAAAVAAIAAAAWIGLRPGSSAPVVAATGSSSASVSPSSAASSATTATTSATTTPAPGPTQAVPAYFVSPYGSGKVGLVREFLPAPLQPGADVTAKVTAALNTALNAQPYVGTDGYLQPWPAGTTASTVGVSPAEITVELSAAGLPGLTPDQQRVSVQQVVWTATAAAGSNVPVRISVAGGGKIFDTMAANTYQRPASDQAYTDLAPVWVDNPSRGQVLPASAPVVVTGQACTFEANVVWELKQGGAVVKQGNTTASIACPTQGSWSVDLGTLPAGDYTFRAFQVSQKDGSVDGQKVVSFSVK